jgi:hypothetical protein
MKSAWQWLEDGTLAIAIRQSVWMYPALEIVHIAGIVLLVGPAFIFDLRLLGLAGNVPVPVLAKDLLVWSRRGLILVIPSGLLLFITNASTLAYDPVFWVKLILLVIAALNALAFDRFILPQFSLTRMPTINQRSKVTAIISILAWLAIITCGRLLAY